MIKIAPGDHAHGQRIVSEFLDQHSTPPAGKALFHYTSVEGAFGIIDTETIYATHIRFLNDPKEWEYGVTSCCAMIEEFGGESVFPHFWTKHVSGFLQQPDLAEVYSACFCERDDLLTQWQGYTPRGGGYSLGFDFQTMKDRRDGLLIRVLYDEAEQRAVVREIFELAEGCIVASLQGVVKGKRADVLNVVAAIVRVLLISNLIAFKQSAFKHEREWRLSTLDLKGTEDSPPLLPVRFRPRDGIIIPFVAFPLRVGAESPLRSVRLGPTVQHADAKRGLRLLLERKGLNGVSIEGTDTPLR